MFSAQLIVAAAVVRIGIPAFDLDRAPTLLAQGLPEYYAAALEAAQCASVLTSARFGPEATEALNACEANIACVAGIGRLLGVDYMLVGSFSKGEAAWETQLRVVDVRTHLTVKELTTEYIGPLRELGGSVRRLAPEICRAINPHWQDPSAPVAQAAAPPAPAAPTPIAQAAPPAASSPSAKKAEQNLDDLAFDTTGLTSDQPAAPPTKVADASHAGPPASALTFDTTGLEPEEPSSVSAKAPPPPPASHPAATPPVVVASAAPPPRPVPTVQPARPVVVAVAEPKPVQPAHPVPVVVVTPPASARTSVAPSKPAVPARPVAIAAATPAARDRVAAAPPRVAAAPVRAPARTSAQPARPASVAVAVNAPKPAPIVIAPVAASPAAPTKQPTLIATNLQPSVSERAVNTLPAPQVLAFLPGPSSRTARKVSISMLGAAATAAALGGGFGYGALLAAHTRLAAQDVPTYNAAQASAVMRGRVSNVAFGAAGVAAITSLVVWFAGDHFFHEHSASGQASLP